MVLTTVKATESHRSRIPDRRPFLHVWIGRIGEDTGPTIIVRILRRYSLNLDIEDIKFGRYGKPESEKTGRLKFNMTNDGGLFLFAVTDYGEIGIDLQGGIDQEKRGEALKTVFAPEELEAITRNPRCLPASAYWAVKEALVKQKGRSIWFGDTLRVVEHINLESAGFWVSVENRWVYAAARGTRGFALALSGSRKPPYPEYLIEESG